MAVKAFEKNAKGYRLQPSHWRKTASTWDIKEIVLLPAEWLWSKLFTLVEACRLRTITLLSNILTNSLSYQSWVYHQSPLGDQWVCVTQIEMLAYFSLLDMVDWARMVVGIRFLAGDKADVLQRTTSVSKPLDQP